MDIVISGIIGTIIGYLQGYAFMHDKKQVHPSVQKSALTKRLSLVAMARHVGIALVLGFLFSRETVLPIATLCGLLVGFWLVILKQTKKRHENRTI